MQSVQSLIWRMQKRLTNVCAEENEQCEKDIALVREHLETQKESRMFG